MDRVGDEPASLIRSFGGHRTESTPPVARRLTSERGAGRLAQLEEAVTVDRRHGDRAHLIVALHAQLDQVAGPPRPELLVELFLRGDGDTVDLQDPIALAEPGARRRPHG